MLRWPYNNNINRQLPNMVDSLLENVAAPQYLFGCLRCQLCCVLETRQSCSAAASQSASFMKIKNAVGRSALGCCIDRRLSKNVLIS